LSKLGDMRAAVRIARAALFDYETRCVCPDEPQCPHALALETADARVTNAAEAYLDATERGWGAR
jgi:hypothetical protein